MRYPLPNRGDAQHAAEGGRRERGETALPQPPVWADGRVTVTPSGCWQWTGPLDRDGYGMGRFVGTIARVHRKAFAEAAGRAIPRDVELDHRCRNRACFRPTHLDPVLRAENGRRRSSRQRATLDRCPMGHRLDAPNGLATPQGGVVCRICDGDSSACWVP